MHGSQVLDRSREVVHRHVPVERGDRRVHIAVRGHRGVPLDGATAVIEPIDAQGSEASRQRVDLTQEVGGGESPLPQRVGRSVGCRRDSRPGRHQVRQES